MAALYVVPSDLTTCTERRYNNGMTNSRRYEPAGTVECKRIGGRRLPDGSYPILAYRHDGNGANEVWQVGYAFQSDIGRGGWIVRDNDGELLISIAEGTKVGTTLADALYMLEKKLMAS